MKYSEDPYVNCPFYAKESKNSLICEGLYDNTGNITTFRTAQYKRLHKDKYCRNGYGECILCRMLLDKYA